MQNVTNHSHVFDGSNLPTTPMGVVKYLEACGIEVKPGAKCLVVGACPNFASLHTYVSTVEGG